jgi:bifunctional enzyme CysN/CysC
LAGDSVPPVDRDCLAVTLDLLRFTTAGSVDDGKSTLIGRLLYDSKQVFEDQLAHVAQASARRGGEGALDLALLTDGLRAEREQGITIDVAYRYFATVKRRFIIADCPGHQQYTRNMVTGASTADLAVILLDARKGVLEQSKRHAFISALLGIPHLVVAVNKMDLVERSQARFDELAMEFAGFATKLDGRASITYIPISALEGDNVVARSEQMPWYDGPTLLELLEEVEVAYDHPDDTPARFPVQWVIRPSNGVTGAGATAAGAGAAATGTDGDIDAGASVDAGDYRGYAGQLSSGSLRRGQEVMVLPGAARTRIAAIDTYDGELEEAVAPMSLTLRLQDELDVSRGALICHPEQAPTVARELQADVCWLNERPLRVGGRYILKHTARHATAVVEELFDRVDVHTLERTGAPQELGLNDIGRVRLRTSVPLTFDSYRRNRRTGSFILIDQDSNETVGAGLVAEQTPA